MKQYGIIGYPLTHSFSKQYFTEKFGRQTPAVFSYENYPLQDISGLPSLLEANPSLAGLNVTIPYKKQVLQFLDDVSGIPEGLQACNCIKIGNGRLLGFNTDVIGFEQSLVPLLEEQHGHALVLGTGGAAEAVQFVLKKLGIAYKMVSRKEEGDTLTYAELIKEIIEQYPLIINTTPLGTFPKVDECPDIPYQFLGSNHLLFDAVYNPPLTLFLRKGKERGAQVLNGEGMLTGQAQAAWKIWEE
jgi:shikimate dehydrogenase